jgi:hypothetical protein
MDARDGKAVETFLAPDFTSVDASGHEINAAQMLQELDALPKDPQKVSKTTLLSVNLVAGNVVVEQRYDMKTVKIAADGTSRNVELITLSKDVWARSNQTWLLQKTQTDELDYYVNGQKVMHKVRQGA